VVKKWLSAVGSAKRHLDLVPVMRIIWENIITNQKKMMIRMDRCGFCGETCIMRKNSIWIIIYSRN